MRLKRAIISLLALLLIGSSIGGGYAYWYFNDVKVKHGSKIDLGTIDNIKENYTFGRNEGEEEVYTIYLFPSAVYTDLYRQYLDKTNTSVTKLPEEYFGYFTFEGTYTNNYPDIKVTSKTSSTSDSETYLDYVQYVYDNYKDVYMYPGYYKEFYEVFEEKGKLYTGGIGNPNVPFQHSDAAYQVENTISRVNGINQFRYDRFGAWARLHSYSESVSNTYEYDTSSDQLGRYLPMKLEVTQTEFKNSFLEKTSTPICSMGDAGGKLPFGEDWFNLSFSNWVVFPKDNNGTYSYPYVGEDENFILWGFQNPDINSYFDMNLNLDVYADDKNVIRLFPFFSNGKNYLSEEYQYGRRDALKLTYKDSNHYLPVFTGTDSSESNQKVKTERYLMYDDDILYSNNDMWPKDSNLKDIDNIAYATMPNVYLENSDSSGRYSFFNCQSDHNNPFASNDQWDGDWEVAFGTNVFDAVVNTYGEGLYNVYLFVANSEHDALSIENSSYINGHDNGFNIAQYASTNYIPGWEELYNKNLIVVNNQNSIFSSLICVGYKPDYFLKLDQTKYEDTDKIKSCCLAFEKVSDFSLVPNLSGNYQSNERLENDISNNLIHKIPFSMYGHEVYPRYSDDSGNSYKIDTSNELTSTNPYIYLLRNLSFDKFSNYYFQIRSGGDYVPNLGYNLSPNLTLGNGHTSSSVVIDPVYDSNGDYSDTLNNSHIFYAGSYFFKDKDLIIDNPDDIKRYGFTLSNTSYQDSTFDILLIYNPSSDSSSNIDVYAYRHRSNFIKIFADDTDFTFDEDGFINHEASNGNLLWEATPYIGDTFNSTIEGIDKVNSNSKTLITFLNRRFDTSDKKKNYCIRDYITNRLIIYYVGEDVTGENIVQGWYIDPFKIRKSYILYIASNAFTPWETNSAF